MVNNLSSDSDIINLFTVLNDDVVTDLINTRRDSNQFHRRTLIRSIFAYIEGVTFILKQAALARTEYAVDLYSNAEKAILADESYSLNKKLEVIAQPKFSRTEDNIFFALKMFMKSKRLMIDLKMKPEEIRVIKDAIGIRNRITHPKKYHDLNIANNELKTVISAYEQYNRLLMINLTRAIGELKGNSVTLCFN